MRSIKAKVVNGVIKPEEEVSIEDGAEVIIIIEEPSTKSKVDMAAFEKLAGVWKDDPGLGSEFLKYIYEKREVVSTREVPDL
jgi:predicted DNA-binding antitoxin AbrB/MazE fold protein